MQLGSKGAALIKSFEQCRLEAYQDQRGIWTIGWGHTGTEVYQGLVWTQAQADMQFILDTNIVVQAVTMNVHVTVSQNEFDALCSLCFNIGSGHFHSSTLLQMLNAGDIAGAAGQFAVWNKTNGQENPGLTRRRAAEEALFSEAA